MFIYIRFELKYNEFNKHKSNYSSLWYFWSFLFTNLLTFNKVLPT